MIDVNTPVTNPDLLNAINEMAEKNTNESKDKVIDEVTKAHFIAPVIISPKPQSPTENNTTTLKQDTTISFNTISNNNENLFLVFTDWEQLGKWQKNANQQTIIVTFNDLASMVLNQQSNTDGFVINSHGRSLIFDKNMISAILNEMERRKNGGVVKNVIQKETQVQLGQPQIYPTDMANAVCEYAKQNSSINSVYLQLMIKENEKSYLLIVDFTGNQNAIFNDIAKSAQDHLNGMFLDMIPYKSDFGKKATSGITPFYKK